jgi:glycosyltransferase involved in cell wall biosynthesis
MSNTLIIPIKNESGNIKHVFESVSSLNIFSRIIFIEGGSTDETLEELLNNLVLSRDTRIIVMQQKVTNCKFGAILEALVKVDSEFITILDGDRTIRDEDINKALTIMHNNSNCIVVGNRLTPDREQGAMPILNLFGNKIFAVLCSIIVKQKISDALSGLKILPTSLLKSKSCEAILDIDKYGDLTILFMAARKKLRIINSDCKYQRRSFGKSSINKLQGSLNLLHTYFHVLYHKCYTDKN